MLTDLKLTIVEWDALDVVHDVLCTRCLHPHVSTKDETVHSIAVGKPSQCAYAVSVFLVMGEQKLKKRMAQHGVVRLVRIEHDWLGRFGKLNHRIHELNRADDRLGIEGTTEHTHLNGGRVGDIDCRIAIGVTPILGKAISIPFVELGTIRTTPISYLVVYLGVGVIVRRVERTAPCKDGTYQLHVVDEIVHLGYRRRLKGLAVYMDMESTRFGIVGVCAGVHKLTAERTPIKFLLMELEGTWHGDELNARVIVKTAIVFGMDEIAIAYPTTDINVFPVRSFRLKLNPIVPQVLATLLSLGTPSAYLVLGGREVVIPQDIIVGVPTDAINTLMAYYTIPKVLKHFTRPRARECATALFAEDILLDGA